MIQGKQKEQKARMVFEKNLKNICCKNCAEVARLHLVPQSLLPKSASTLGDARNRTLLEALTVAKTGSSLSSSSKAKEQRDADGGAVRRRREADGDGWRITKLNENVMSILLFCYFVVASSQLLCVYCYFSMNFVTLIRARLLCLLRLTMLRWNELDNFDQDM